MKIKWEGLSPEEQRIGRSIFLLVGSEPRLLEFLFDPMEFRIRRRAGILRDEAWEFSDAEQLQIRVALDIWSGSGHVQLWELFEGWEASEWAKFIRAMGELKNLPSGTLC